MPDHYQALNVGMTADLAAIKKAYRKVSLLYHPDKTIHLSAPERAQREHLFKLANVAFEVLSDPQKRRVYDHNLGVSQACPQEPDITTTTRPPDDYWPQNSYGPTHGHEPQGGRAPPPPQPSNPQHGGPEGHKGPRGYSGSPSIRRAPISSHRFTTTTLGTPPENNWCYSEVVEKSDYTTLSFSNWLRWRFLIGISNRFILIARPILPQEQQPESIAIRLPVQRAPMKANRILTDMYVDLRSAPGSQHTVLCSTLVEVPEGLELLVEIIIAPKEMQKNIQGPILWKWTYNIDHEPLLAGMRVKATSLVFHPLKPDYVPMSNGGMPGIPYPVWSPMHSLVRQYPGVRIDDSAPETYCTKEEQLSKTFWRLVAVGLL